MDNQSHPPHLSFMPSIRCLRKSSWKESSKGEQFYPVLDEENKHLTYLIARKDMDGVETVRGDEAKAILKTLGLDTALLHAQFANYCYRTTKRRFKGYLRLCHRRPAYQVSKPERKEEKRPQDRKRTRLSGKNRYRNLRNIYTPSGITYQFGEHGARRKNMEDRKTGTLWIISLLETSQILMGTDIKDMTVTMDFVAQVMPGPWSQMEKGRNKHLLYRHIPKEIWNSTIRKNGGEPAGYSGLHAT